MIAEFYDVVSLLKNREEVKLFFRDLLSPDEIAMLMRRVEVATLLSGGFTYEQITELLGAGKAKVVNVQKSLSRHGEGYRIAIQRLLKLRKAKIKKFKKEERKAQSSFERLKDKYPLHFLLFRLIDEIGELLSEKGDENKEAALTTPSNAPIIKKGLKKGLKRKR